MFEITGRESKGSYTCNISALLYPDKAAPDRLANGHLSTDELIEQLENNQMTLKELGKYTLQNNFSVDTNKIVPDKSLLFKGRISNFFIIVLWYSIDWYCINNVLYNNYVLI